METVRDNQGTKVRYEDTQRPLLLSTSGNAAHALLLGSSKDSMDRPFPYPCRHGTSFTRTARLPLCPAVIAITTSCRLPIQAHAPDRQLQVSVQFHRYDGQIISGGWALLSFFRPGHQLRLV